MKEDQARIVQELMSQKRSLETEVSALKWKIEELENISMANNESPAMAPPSNVTSGDAVDSVNGAANQSPGNAAGNSAGGFVDVGTTDQALVEANSFRQQNLAPQSIQQFDSSVLSGTSPAESPFKSPSAAQLFGAPEQQEKSILGLKIDLLQEKISEMEVSQMKAFEKSLMLKSWTRTLELDNLKMQSKLDRIHSSIQDGKTGNLKSRALRDEVLRLVDAPHDRESEV